MEVWKLFLIVIWALFLWHRIREYWIETRYGEHLAFVILTIVILYIIAGYVNWDFLFYKIGGNFKSVKL